MKMRTTYDIDEIEESSSKSNYELFFEEDRKETDVEKKYFEMIGEE